MRVLSSFAVPVERDVAWSTLCDLPRIAPCLPGARIDREVKSTGSPTFEGQFSIKVGPVRASYAGQISIVEMDEAGGRIVLSGRGSDAGGAGSVSAMITGQLRAAEAGCVVDLDTDLDVKGRLSQFTGRSSMVQGIADRVIATFASNVGAEMVRGPQSPEAATAIDGVVSSGVGPSQVGLGSNAEFDAVSFGMEMIKGALGPRLLASVAGAFGIGWLMGRRGRKSAGVTFHLSLGNLKALSGKRDLGE